MTGLFPSYSQPLRSRLAGQGKAFWVLSWRLMSRPANQLHNFSQLRLIDPEFLGQLLQRT